MQIAPRIISTAKIFGMYVVFLMNDSRLIFDNIKLKANIVNPKPIQYSIILNATNMWSADVTRREINEIKYTLQHEAHAIDVKRPEVNDPIIPSLSCDFTLMKLNEQPKSIRIPIISNNVAYKKHYCQCNVPCRRLSDNGLDVTSQTI